jgi:hypothetical protein
MKERITQILLVAVIVLLSALLLKESSRNASAGETAPVVRARAFELVDERGQVRGQMFLGEDGGGNIRLRETSGKVGVKLGTSPKGSGLILFDKEVNPTIELVTNEKGTSVSLTEKGKEKRVFKP